MENEPNLTNSYLKSSAFKSYFELVNKMHNYENALFERYCSQATYMINVVMRKNILAIRICNKDTCKLGVFLTKSQMQKFTKKSLYSSDVYI